MKRFIIEDHTDLHPGQVFDMVASVVHEGRISNGKRQYCYFSTFKVGSGEMGKKKKFKEYGVASFLNKKSDRFVVTEIKENSNEAA